jgi:hypothetical protein
VKDEGLKISQEKPRCCTDLPDGRIRPLNSLAWDIPGPCHPAYSPGRLGRAHGSTRGGLSLASREKLPGGASIDNPRSRHTESRRIDCSLVSRWYAGMPREAFLLLLWDVRRALIYGVNSVSPGYRYPQRVAYNKVGSDVTLNCPGQLRLNPHTSAHRHIRDSAGIRQSIYEAFMKSVQLFLHQISAKNLERKKHLVALFTFHFKVIWHRKSDKVT